MRRVGRTRIAIRAWVSATNIRPSLQRLQATFPARGEGPESFRKESAPIVPGATAALCIFPRNQRKTGTAKMARQGHHYQNVEPEP